LQSEGKLLKFGNKNAVWEIFCSVAQDKAAGITSKSACKKNWRLKIIRGSQKTTFGTECIKNNTNC
jgi:hypothetical protein